jgi:hypothetical protein
MRKISRMRVRTTRWKTRGMRIRATAKTAATAAALRPKRRATAPSETWPAFASTGTTAIIGTMARSWKMRTPSEIRPWGESVSPRSARILRTTAVLLSETRKP